MLAVPAVVAQEQVKVHGRDQEKLDYRVTFGGPTDPCRSSHFRPVDASGTAATVHVSLRDLVPRFCVGAFGSTPGLLVTFQEL